MPAKKQSTMERSEDLLQLLSTKKTILNRDFVGLAGTSMLQASSHCVHSSATGKK